MSKVQSDAPRTIPKQVTARVYRLPIRADFLVTVPDDHGGRVVVVGKKTRPKAPHSESFFIGMMLNLDALVPPATQWAKLAFDGDRLTHDGDDLPADELALIFRALGLLVESWQPAKAAS